MGEISTQVSSNCGVVILPWKPLLGICTVYSYIAVHCYTFRRISFGRAFKNIFFNIGNGKKTSGADVEVCYRG